MKKDWTTLNGELETHGFSLRRVSTNTSKNWTNVIEPGTIHLFLNIRGTSLVFGPTTRMPMVSKTLGICHIGKLDGVIASFADAQETNELIVLCVTAEWVNKNFGSRKQSLHCNLVQLLDKKSQHSVLLNKVRSMSYLEHELCHSLLNPPVHDDAKAFWYLAKIIELLSIHLFKSPKLGANEIFCSKQKRVANQRVDKVMIWLEENLDQPLDLKTLAGSIHCSASYLSRVFSENMGTTISKKLRAMRIDKSAELLQSGDYNVTEAAMEVGYNSLSHFTKAFHEERGVNPSDFIRTL